MSANFKKLLFLPKGLALLLACLPAALLAADDNYIAANASNITQEASQAPKFTEASPAKPNQATVELVAVVEALLKNEDAIFSYSEAFGLEVSIRGIAHNISLLLAKANFDSLVIDQTYMENYYTRNHEFYEKWKGEGDSLKKFSHVVVEKLTQAEKDTLLIYTSSCYYLKMNSFLRLLGNTDEIKKASEVSLETLNTEAKEVLISCCLAISGLNRINTHIEPGIDILRREESLPDIEINKILQAIDTISSSQCTTNGDCVAKGIGITHTNNLISTSMVKPFDAFTETPFFSKKQSMVIKFLNTHGADVSKISFWANEHECLMPPSYIQWISIDDYYDNDHVLNCEKDAICI